MAKQARTPPHNIDAETSVLGSILIDPEAIVKIADILEPDSFYEPAHQKMYQAMATLYEARQPIDAVTLTTQLKKQKDLKKAGGASKIAELTNSVSTSANIVAYAKSVADAYTKRKLISLSGELGELAFDEAQEVRDILDTTEQRVFSLSQVQNKAAFTPIKDTLIESFERLDELQKNGSEIRGVPTGFQDLDRTLAGLQNSNLIILAARPGMGKTALALNIAHNVAVGAKKTGWLFFIGNE